MMSVRNRHLLAAIACLALLTTFLALFLLLSERGTARGLEDLAGVVERIQTDRLSGIDDALADLAAAVGEARRGDVAMRGDLSRIDGRLAAIRDGLDRLEAEKIGLESLDRLRNEVRLLGGELDAFVREGLRWNVQILALSKQIQALQDRVARGD